MTLFHLSPVPLVRPRLSWSRRNSAASADAPTNKRKRTVRFSRQRSEAIDSNYEISESLRKLLWYRKKDLMAIKIKVDSTVQREVVGFNKEHCCRGLESQISDCVSPSQSRHYRHKKFVRGLLSLQQSQKRESTTARDEALRQYCLAAGSQQQHSCARMRAKQDAIAALKQHESSFVVTFSKQLTLVTKIHSSKDDAFPFPPPTPSRAALCRSPSQQSATHTPRAA